MIGSLVGTTTCWQFSLWGLTCCCHFASPSTQWTAFCVSMDLLCQGTYQTDESEGLRSAICAASDLPEEQAEQALQHLSSKDPTLLRKLVEQHGTFSTQVISAELSAIAERMDVLEVEVMEVKTDVKEVKITLAQIEDQIQRAAIQQEERTLLAGYLKEWWAQVCR